MVREAEMAIAGQLGPRISWEAPRLEGDWDLIIAGADLDDGDCGFGVELSDSAFQGEDGSWSSSRLDQAARAYRRAAGWDFEPDDAGIWLLMLAPTSAVGTNEEMSYYGHLVGFVILYDRNEDGEYESVGHIWTASAWRRRGVARRLLEEARMRFGFERIEGPYTDDGNAFIKACTPKDEPA